MFQKAIIGNRVLYLCSHCKPQSHLNGYLIFKLSRFSTTASLASNAKVSVATHETHTGENKISLLNHKAHLAKKTLLKIKRTPFIKNLFVGNYDKDILAFPEIHDNKEIEAINRMSDQVRRYIIANVDSEQVDRTSTFPETALDDMKKMGLFGSQVPIEYGGLGLTATEHVRIMEACSVDSVLPLLINTHHSISVQAFLTHASENIRSMYLPKLATGELTATLGFSEQQNICDVSCVHTVASKLKSNTQYILSGKKSWVVNAENADIFLVLAKTVDPEGVSEEDTYAVYLVERDSPGVVVHKPDEKLGIKGANICSVEFHETPVPLENVIGSSKNGHEIVLSTLMMNRFLIGAFTSGLAKGLIEIATDHCINTNLFLKQLMEHESAKHIIGRIMRKTYAMESVTYLTAGLFDSTLEPDMNLEFSAVKVFCTEGLWYCVNELLSLMGPAASLSGHPVERAIRDSRMWLMFEGPNDLIRQFISLSALDHCKEAIANDVQKLRNPMFFPRFTFRRLLMNFRHERGNLKATMDLQGYLHPTLQVAANYMEYSVQKLQHAFETLLQQTGREILSHQVSLGRLAEMAIEIYAMSAVCSRASRAYCIGLPCADVEVTLAMAYCQDGYDKINKIHEEVLQGPGTTDLDLTRVGKVTCHKNGYILTPPFTRTY